MSDSVRPQRQQPSRLPCPWDSPGKNTGVHCHFLLQCTKVSESEVAQSCLTLSDPMDCSLPGSSVQCNRPRFNSCIGKIPWRRKWQRTPVSLPGKSHGQRSLVDCSPRGRKESDMTERLHFTLSFDPASRDLSYKKKNLVKILT